MFADKVADFPLGTTIPADAGHVAGKSVLHCVASLGGGGAERQVTYLCNGLAENGWDVSLAILNSGMNAERLDRRVRVIPLPHANAYDPRLLWHLASIVRRLRPCVIQTWLPLMDVLGGVTSALFAVPWVGTERSSALQYTNNWKNRLRLFLFRRAGGVIANSAAGCAFLDAHLPSRVRRYVVPNAVPLHEIDELPALPREAMGIRDENEVILFAGRFSSEKNLGTLFAALQQVLRSRPRAVAVLCGDGPERPQWLEWVRQRGLADRVLMPGYVHDLPAWMKSADVLAFPSWHEGFPNVVIEAMIAGCPLVLSDIPEHRDIVDKTSAIFVSPESVPSLRDAIIETLDDRAAAAARSSRARQAALPYTISAMTRSYEAIYRELMNRPRAR